MGLMDDKWDRLAIEEMVKVFRSMSFGDDAIGPKTPVGNLSDTEVGWYCAAVLFEWIKVKAKQAVEEGTNSNLTIRTMSGHDPSPWELGTLEALLPALGDVVESIGADKPVGQYSKGDICWLIWTAIKLYRSAEAGRDEAENDTVTYPAKPNSPFADIGSTLLAG